MVFENLTLFEFNVEDAQFGPKAIRSGADTEGPDDVMEIETEGTGGMGRFPFMFGAGILLSILAVIAARRFFGSDDGIEIEDADVDAAVEA